MKSRLLLSIFISSLTAWAAGEESVLHSFREEQDGATP